MQKNLDATRNGHLYACIDKATFLEINQSGRSHNLKAQVVY